MALKEAQMGQPGPRVEQEGRMRPVLCQPAMRSALWLDRNQPLPRSRPGLARERGLRLG